MDNINLIPQASVGTKPMGFAYRQNSTVSTKQTPVVTKRPQCKMTCKGRDTYINWNTRISYVLNDDILRDIVLQVGSEQGFSPIEILHLIEVLDEVEEPSPNQPIEYALSSCVQKILEAASAVKEHVDELKILLFYYEYLELLDGIECQKHGSSPCVPADGDEEPENLDTWSCLFDPQEPTRGHQNGDYWDTMKVITVKDLKPFPIYVEDTEPYMGTMTYETYKKRVWVANMARSVRPS